MPETEFVFFHLIHTCWVGVACLSQMPVVLTARPSPICCAGSDQAHLLEVKGVCPLPTWTLRSHVGRHRQHKGVFGQAFDPAGRDRTGGSASWCFNEEMCFLHLDSEDCVSTAGWMQCTWLHQETRSAKSIRFSRPFFPSSVLHTCVQTQSRNVFKCKTNFWICQNSYFLLQFLPNLHSFLLQLLHSLLASQPRKVSKVQKQPAKLTDFWFCDFYGLMFHTLEAAVWFFHIFSL